MATVKFLDADNGTVGLPNGKLVKVVNGLAEIPDQFLGDFQNEKLYEIQSVKRVVIEEETVKAGRVVSERTLQSKPAAKAPRPYIGNKRAKKPTK